MTIMNDRAEKIVRLAYEEIGSPYVFGAIGEDCTPSLRGRRQRSEHPTIRSKCQVLMGAAKDCSGCVFEGRRMYDCRGFTYWLLKQVGILISTVGATTQYNTASSWIRRGNIIHMPDVVCCVFVQNGSKMSHTGMHIGGGVVIDCSTGVTKKTVKGFTHYAIPRGLYTEEELESAEEVSAMSETAKGAEKSAEKTVYRKGSTGDGVKMIQARLSLLGYDPGEADGVYGAQTIAAVRAFQADTYGLTVDGIAGPLTLAALEEAFSEYLAAQEEAEQKAAKAEQDPSETSQSGENVSGSAEKADQGGVSALVCSLGVDGVRVSAEGIEILLPHRVARELYDRLAALLAPEEMDDGK